MSKFYILLILIHEQNKEKINILIDFPLGKWFVFL